MFYKVEYQKRAHQEVEKIFRVLLPEQGLAVREEQIRLCHEMLDTLLGERIALCDAGVGIGKTYAYLVACVLMRKYSILMERNSLPKQHPVVVSTSSIALQKAILSEYVPFLSRVLVEQGIIQTPLRAVVRKGKEHFVCDNRLEQRIEAIRHKQKNAVQREALLSLRKHYDMDTVKDLSGFDRRLVCVPKFCPRECPGRQTCRYQRYLEESKKQDVFLQICNHNYLLADAFHRREEYKPLLTDYRALVVDEAHKLPEAARQMFGKNLCMDDIREIAYYLEREHQNVEARTLKAGMYSIFTIIGESHIFSHGIKENFQLTGECEFCLWEGIQMIERMMEQLKGVVPKWVLNRLQEAKEVLECFLQKNSKYVLHLRMDKEKIPVLCAASREIPQLLREMLWDREQALSVILTSGTLKAGKGFARTLQMTGLEGRTDVQSYVAESPFAYEENCLLYLPKNLQKCKRGSREEVEMVAGQIHSLICSTYGHTLVLFTSYTLMGSVYQILRDGIPFPMVEVWRHSQEEILRFKTMENAVLFAAGSCWEGVDFPGDMVSSLIIVKLPFAVPDPISEAEKETYESLEDYIQSIIVPDMQKKLRQGFGRAIRTETDTCVVSILDIRAVKGGKYHEDVMCALPPCQMAEELREVQDFIRSRKGVEYYL
ncbi:MULTISPECIES: ATP-dependent DNA helicase [Lachnospiraceae]|jgi:ATP-dependent DNA helicase DinG|uniref:ATP-dependent DNA helicase n=1 Tax=Coprococcus comes TaxID=410072 RepID=A0A3R5XP51_9FIRM|nr:ATP-dependent DNA helicase [Coprococcus comes]MDU5385218.1 ATP-dependent DNA helicase [Blautia producta]MDY4669121.1 ATP-dependent DNA helicase [Oliverpabstia sp.]RGU46853.1 ATP-dependent DNA helicase [Coprococcus comes]